MCTHCLFTCAEVPLIPSASHEIAPRSLSRSPHTHPGPLAARHATRSSSSALAVSLSLSRLRSRACPHTLSRARCSLLALVGSRRLSLSLPLGLSALVHPSNVPPCPPLPPSAGSHSHASPGPVARGLPLSLSRSHACSGLSAGFAAARPRRLSPSLSLPLRLALSCTRSGLPAAPPGLPARPSAAAQSLLMRVGAGAGRSSGSGS